MRKGPPQHKTDTPSRTQQSFGQDEREKLKEDWLKLLFTALWQKGGAAETVVLGLKSVSEA